jgi:hypothetical protein
VHALDVFCPPVIVAAPVGIFLHFDRSLHLIHRLAGGDGGFDFGFQILDILAVIGGVLFGAERAVTGRQEALSH